MTKKIKYNGRKITPQELELLQQCDGKHSTLSELFNCISCAVLLEQ